MNSENIKKALRMAVNVGCGFEGDAEDAASLLSLIETNEARIAELEAERRWIPVSERLPEVNEDVFTLVYDTNDGSTSVCALKHHGDGVWFIWDKGYYVVTHWMPMPKPPEVQ